MKYSSLSVSCSPRRFHRPRTRCRSRRFAPNTSSTSRALRLSPPSERSSRATRCACDLCPSSLVVRMRVPLIVSILVLLCVRSAGHWPEQGALALLEWTRRRRPLSRGRHARRDRVRGISGACARRLQNRLERCFFRVKFSWAKSIAPDCEFARCIKSLESIHFATWRTFATVFLNYLLIEWWLSSDWVQYE